VAPPNSLVAIIVIEYQIVTQVIVCAHIATIIGPLSNQEAQGPFLLGGTNHSRFQGRVTFEGQHYTINDCSIGSMRTMDRSV